MNKSGGTDFAPFVFMLESLNIDSSVLFNLSDPTVAGSAWVFFKTDAKIQLYPVI